ncbi:MAG: c-type cytochrome [Myxococcales bacterium]|nr:c-type cytochrome [Myxococcales bacterium]
MGCASCHDPRTDHTDGAGYPKIVPTNPAYREEASTLFRTPSLAFVGGSEPYMHDGSRSTLEKVVELNMDKMGRTTQLSAEDKKALVAYLRTL